MDSDTIRARIAHIQESCGRIRGKIDAVHCSVKTAADEISGPDRDRIDPAYNNLQFELAALYNTVRESEYTSYELSVYLDRLERQDAAVQVGRRRRRKMLSRANRDCATIERGLVDMESSVDEMLARIDQGSLR